MPDVWFMHESDVVWHSMDAYPVNRAARFVERQQLLYFGFVVANSSVAGHAQTDCWYRGSPSLGHISMAEGTVQSNVLDVSSMRKCDRLSRAFVETKDV